MPRSDAPEPSDATGYLRWLAPRVERNQRAHYRSCEKFERVHFWLGVCLVVAASATLGHDLAPGYPGSDVIKIVLAVLTALFGGLQTFARYDLQAGRHRSSAVAYGVLHRKVRARTCGAYTDAQNAEALDGILSDYRLISETAPVTAYSERLATEAQGKT